MEREIEKSLKRFLKRSIKITLGFIVAFMINGNTGYAEEKIFEAEAIYIDNKEENVEGEIEEKVEIKKDESIRINSNSEYAININNENNNGYGDNEKFGFVNIDTKEKFIIGDNNNENSIVKNGIRIDTYAGTVNINAEKGIIINIKGDTLIGTTESGHINLNSKGDIVLNAESNNNDIVMGYISNLNNSHVTATDKETNEISLVGINGIRKSEINIETTGNIIFTANETNENNLMNIGIFSAGTRKNGDIVTNDGDDRNDKYIDEDGYVMSEENRTKLKGNNIDITITNKYGLANGILVQDSDKVFVNLNSVNNNSLTVISENSDSIGIDTADGNVKFESLNGSNTVKAITQNNEKLGIGIQIENNKSNHWDNSDYHNRIDLIAKKDNTVFGTTTAILSTGADTIIDIKSNSGTNTMQSERDTTINANDKSQVLLTSELGSNQVLAGKLSKDGYGDKTAISALGGSNVILKSGVLNNIAGAIYANGTGTNVELISSDDGTNNIISSSAHGSFEANQEHIVSAVYAQKDSNVTIDSGENGVNVIQSHFDFLHNEDSERTVWAQQSGNIDINGQTFITASSADINTDPDSEIVTNSRGIALTAGSGESLDDYKNPDGSLKDIALEDRSTINLNYNKESGITGDIVSGYGGLLNITPKNDNSKIIIQGNILAGNKGQANVNLGNGGIWYGRADDYGDADSKHETFFNPAFSNEIIEGGEVNLTMGDNSTWYVQGQSWITSINTENAKNVTIDLVSSNTDRNSSSHALTINNLNGNADFHMSLDGNRDVSDMLYIKNANGQYNITLADTITEEDMFANGLSGLRFATVGAGSNVEFNVGTKEQGIFNVQYEVETDSYENNEENSIYNGNEMTSDKPGDSSVDDFFDTENEDTTETAKLDNSTLENTLEETTNFKIVGKKNETTNDIGTTVVEMAKANYASAVYMDNLNKRLGDMTFANGSDGVWIRMRNDRVGEDEVYRLHNYMTQVGYDKAYNIENGTEHRGIAFEYTRGEMEYKDINGESNIDRYMVSLYNTRLYNNGMYSDIVARAGYMESDFEIYGRETGAKATGDYDNLIFGLSGEFGRRFDFSDNYYFEPQVQLQYTYIQDSDYTTNQDTKVEYSDINSLIGRFGFRLGHDFYNENSKDNTIYLKADVNHEFLGEQDVEARDLTGTMKETYDNDKSWFDVGIGGAKNLTEDLNVYADIERQFGEAKDNSWQFNLGFRYSF